MNITHIVAASLNNVIGKNDSLLWKLPKDMKFFKNQTWALPVIMGRKTFKSLGNKPLNGRFNIVVTRQKEVSFSEAVTIAHSIDEALHLCKQKQYNEVMIIGGGDIYKQTLPLANKVLLTRVETEIEGDTFYPILPVSDWSLAFEEHFMADDKHAFPFRFETWLRK